MNKNIGIVKRDTLVENMETKIVGANFNSQSKDHRGITLVALIITIVVMLILAGVTLSITLGENGIFSQSKLAVQKYENARLKEEQELQNVANEISSLGVASNRDETVTITQATYDALLQRITDLETANNNVNTQLQELEFLKDNAVKYPDYTSVLKTMSTQGDSWTATEDCFIVGWLASTDEYSAVVYVNGKDVCGVGNSSNPRVGMYGCAYAKKGSTISTRADHGSYAVTIYALQKNS